MIYEIKLPHGSVVVATGEAKSRNDAGQKFCEKYKYVDISRFSHKSSYSEFSAKSVTGERREFIVSELMMDF